MKPDYSYDRDNFRPLGLQLFLEKVRPSPMPLRSVAGAAAEARLPQMVDSETGPEAGNFLEVKREVFALRDGDNQNPYSWDFDLCNQTLANFNYRKMTLVRDYANLIDSDMASTAFDTVFSLAPKPTEQFSPPLPQLADQHLIISCDATQATAIARARTGKSYIIEGPPGTGKSQTITNLIADYVARGKRVLFVCEKRAAIDIVFHRLRQQGLDELCCLIHDSQTDKKAFIQDLKHTYERCLSSDQLDLEDVQSARARTLRAMEQDLASLRDFSEAMQKPHETTGIPLRSLLHRLVEIWGRAREQPPELEDALPDYAAWLHHGNVVERLRRALHDLGEDLCFAKNPLRWLGKGVLESDRPFEALATWIGQAIALLESIQLTLEPLGIPLEQRDTIEKLRAIVEFASRAGPLVHAEMLGVLSKGSAANRFDRQAAKLAETNLALLQAQEKASPWNDPLPPLDTENALSQASKFEHSPFRILRPSYWRLKSVVRARYDFRRHAVAPRMVKVLSDLRAQHQLQAAVSSLCEQASKDWRTDNVESMCSLVFELRKDPLLAQPAVKSRLRYLAGSVEGGSLCESLADQHERITELDKTLGLLLAEYQGLKLSELAEILFQLREQSGALAEMLPLLGEVASLPDSFSHALRHSPLPLDQFEGAAGQKSVNLVFRQDRALFRFDGRMLIRKMEQLEKHHGEWLLQNGRCIRAAVRQQFRDHVSISSSPPSQLDIDQKAFKKTYTAGRRELEHEFGKTMRYKSIRDLAASGAGHVIQDLKPIWLMSPLSVSDTLPLEPTYFDVVIFDEASQITLEEAIPALYRSHQVIVVGDEMQLPPTKFFASARGEDDSIFVEEEGERIEVDLTCDSFLTQSAKNLEKTLLAWHYRSRYEALISFSNAAFYGGSLFTIPDRQRFMKTQDELRVSEIGQAGEYVDALLARSISFHFMENGVYENRRNQSEAAYIALLVRGLLERQTGLSIGIVAFSEAQQTEIEDALRRLAEDDSEFAAQLEAEYLREENDQQYGLFVKNLENVQGDERDIILMSVCYAKGPSGRMLMNFGPINQEGGEKRLNVIFSRHKHHMAVVSSIRHDEITNDHNDGANCLKSFLQYAAATSRGELAPARRVLEGVHSVAHKALAPVQQADAVVAALATALQARGYAVDLHVGQSRFRCDLAIAHKSQSHYQLGILVDTSATYQNPNLLDRYLMQPSILRAFGWKCALVLTKDWYHNPDGVLAEIERLLVGQVVEDASSTRYKLP